MDTIDDRDPPSAPTEPVTQVWAVDVGEVTDVHGEIDLSTGAAFDQIIATAARRASERDVADVHVDLTHVKYIGVAGARTLVLAAAELGPGRQLVLHHPPPMLLRILDLAWPAMRGLGRSA